MARRNIEQAALHSLALGMLGLLLREPGTFQKLLGDDELMSKFKQAQRKRCTAKYPPRPKRDQYPIQCWVEVD